MLKKTVTYTDYNGVECRDDLYFNLSEAEIVEMEFGTTGGFAESLNRIASTQDKPAMIKFFKDIMLKAYGEKSPDGKRFVKSEEISTAFSQTEAYNTLFMELMTDAKELARFVNGIIPESSSTSERVELVASSIPNDK